jgi:acyl-CoA synthetase (NDP forming)
VIATGNEADVDVAECIDYLVQDEDTRVICAAIESCRDGARLRAALLKAADAGKPVVIMKIGHTEIGAAAAATHTGSLAGNDAVYGAVFAECGALRAYSIEEMLDIAYVCATATHLPDNDEIGIVTGSGGVGILMADNATELGLTLPAFPAATADALRAILPFAVPANPYDTTAQVTSVPDGLARVLSAIAEGSDCATLFAYLAHVGLSPERFAPLERSLCALRQAHPDRLLVLVMLSDKGVTQRLEAARIAVFEDPSRAVRAVAGAARLRTLRAQLHRLPAPRAIAAKALPPVGNESEAKAVLANAGVSVLPEHLCASASAAARAGEAVGFPVVAKIVSPDIPHKTEIGGVILDIPDAAALEAAYRTLMERAAAAAPQARIAGVLVAPMLKGGIETIVGVHMDPVFGPMAMFGLGGTAVELFKDVAFASAPLTRERAQWLVRQVRSSRLLRGWRGGPMYDEAALVDTLCRVSSLAADHAGELEGIDINPFVVLPQGGFCLDALISLHPEN